MTIIDMHAHARKASIARVEKMQKAEVRRLSEEAETNARVAENDSQRRIHISALDHAISAAWVSPTLGPDLTGKAILSICERLGGGPLLKTLRDSLELITAKGGE